MDITELVQFREEMEQDPEKLERIYRGMATAKDSASDHLAMGLYLLRQLNAMAGMLDADYDEIEADVFNNAESRCYDREARSWRRSR